MKDPPPLHSKKTSRASKNQVSVFSFLRQEPLDLEHDFPNLRILSNEEVTELSNLTYAELSNLMKLKNINHETVYNKYLLLVNLIFSDKPLHSIWNKLCLEDCDPRLDADPRIVDHTTIVNKKKQFVESVLSDPQNFDIFRDELTKPESTLDKDCSIIYFGQRSILSFINSIEDNQDKENLLKKTMLLFKILHCKVEQGSLFNGDMQKLVVSIFKHNTALFLNLNNLKHEIFAEHILFNFLNFESIKEIFSSMKNLSVDKISLLSTFLEPENFRKLLKEKFVPDETLSHLETIDKEKEFYIIKELDLIQSLAPIWNTFIDLLINFKDKKTQVLSLRLETIQLYFKMIKTIGSDHIKLVELILDSKIFEKLCQNSLEKEELTSEEIFEKKQNFLKDTFPKKILLLHALKIKENPSIQTNLIEISLAEGYDELFDYHKSKDIYSYFALLYFVDFKNYYDLCKRLPDKATLSEDELKTKHLELFNSSLQSDEERLKFLTLEFYTFHNSNSTYNEIKRNILLKLTLNYIAINNRLLSR